jgi:hypothetical protein
MAKDELYNQLLEKVQNEGGFLSFEPKERPSVLLRDEETNRRATVAAIFESADDSSPLRLVTNRFIAWDVYDYLDAEEIEHLLSRV